MTDQSTSAIRPGAAVKDTILGAAIEVLAVHGLNNWTVEEVANRSRCAKGLINYHYRTKRELLGLAPARSYRMQWNLNIQRQLTRSLALTLGYVGSTGVHLADISDDSDQVPP